MKENMGKDFIRISRSFIINLSEVTKFISNTIVLTKTRKVPLGKSYRKEFIKVMRED